ncbi:MAG TPA: DUF2505 family protein [Kofleriaceae bacterium]|nr:DUF2505 family protein [Kofleriaceae bacterium]
MTPFRFEHEFRADSAAQFWRGYFDEQHIAHLDAELGLRARELKERREDEHTLYRVVRVVPERELPGWLRKLTGAGLDYEERLTFHKDENRCELLILPSLFSSRTRIEGTYDVQELGPGRLLRRFFGEIDIRVPVIGGRVERSVLADMESSYRRAMVMTQAWLDADSAL